MRSNETHPRNALSVVDSEANDIFLCLLHAGLNHVSFNFHTSLVSHYLSLGTAAEGKQNALIHLSGLLFFSPFHLLYFLDF